VTDQQIISHLSFYLGAFRALLFKHADSLTYEDMERIREADEVIETLFYKDLYDKKTTRDSNEN
jgi:hypothetical protein